MRARDERPVEHKGTAYRIFRLLAWVNGLAAVGLALLLALPSFIDWSDYKEKIARFGAQAYGLDIKIEGALYAQFLPSPVFKLNRVTVSRPGKDAANPLFIKRADVELAFLPLLSGKIEPRALLLHAPDFVFGISEDNSLTYPIGVKEIFTGHNSGTISRFGVLEAGFYRLSAKGSSEAFLQDIQFLAEKSAGTENWSLQGRFLARDVTHNFHIVTRGRPEKSITYIDAQIKNTAEADLTHSFNGSVQERGNAIALRGRYQAAGRIQQLEKLYAVRARGDIKLSQDEVNVSGFTLNAAPVPKKEDTQTAKPVIVTLDLKAQKTDVSDKWQLQSDLYTENMDENHLTNMFFDAQEQAGNMDMLIKLNALAKVLEGQVSIRAKDMQINRRLFPSVYGNILFQQGLMHISDAGARLPGGGRLQTDRLTAQEGVRNNTSELQYKGAVYLKSSQAQDILALLPIERDDRMLRRFSQGANDISMSGILQLSRSNVSFKSDNLLVNDAKGRAAFILRKGRDIRRDIFLNLEKVNLDRLLRTDDKNLISLLADFSHQDTSIADADQRERISKFDISLNKLLWRGTALQDIRAKGQVASDNLVLRDLSIGGPDETGLSLKLKGDVRGLSRRPEGQFDLTLKSPQALDALSLFAPKFLLSQKGKELVKQADVVSPLNVNARLSSQPEAGKNWSLSLSGQLASTEFSSEGVFDPVFSSKGLGLEDVDVQFELANPSSRVLAAQIFGQSLPELEAIPETEGYLRASLSGADETGFDIALGGEVSDLQLTLGGTVKSLTHEPSIAAQIKLFSPKSIALMQFAGVDHSGRVGKTEYVANIAGSGSQYVISGGHGEIAGQPVQVEANMDLSGIKPALSARAHLAEIGPRHLSSALAAVLKPQSGLRDMTSRIDTQITLSTPFMRLRDGVAVSNAQTQIIFKGEKTIFELLEGEVYGGNLLVKAEAKMQGARTEISAQYELKDAELERVLVQESLEKIAKGTFTLAGELTAAPEDITNITKALNGRGYIKAGAGELRGLNPAAFGRSVRFVSNGTELDGMIGGILSEGAIPFSQFQSAFTIKDGVVHSDKTQLVSREVRAQNKTRIDLKTARINSEWTFALNRLPKTPAIKLQYAGTPHRLTRRLESTALRTYLMAMMRKGESLSARFANQRLPAKKVDDVITGSVKRKLMKKPLALDNIKIVPRANPLRGSQ